MAHSTGGPRGHCVCCPLEERGPETVLLKSGCGPEPGGPAGPSHHRRVKISAPGCNQSPGLLQRLGREGRTAREDALFQVETNGTV